jgi:hypothetical protein
MVAQKAILTKENMIMRRWQGDPGCYFCGVNETVDRLLFECPIAKVVWGIKVMCFQQKKIDQFHMNNFGPRSIKLSPEGISFI